MDVMSHINIFCYQLEMDWEEDAFLDEDFPEPLEEEEEETEVAQFTSTGSNFTYEVNMCSGLLSRICSIIKTNISIL